MFYPLLMIAAYLIASVDVYGLTIPETSIPVTYETTTDPPPVRSKVPSSQYARVRGELSNRNKDQSGFYFTAGPRIFNSLLQQKQQNQQQQQQEQQQPEFKGPIMVEECDKPSHKPSFSAYDYTILLGMLVISLGIGVFYGFFKKNSGSADDFLLGSEMSILPVTLSLTTSFITAIELLGNPSEMYNYGTQYVLIVIPMVIVIPVAVKIFYPIYFKMELTSCYEYLGIRFGKELRIYGAVLYIIQMCFYTAVAVLAPAIALSKATGLDTKIAVILIYLVCVFYSSQGGMKAVVIADTFQAVVLAVSLVLVIAVGCFYSGNPAEVFTKATERDRLEFFNFDFDPTTRHTVWTIVIGGFFYWASLFCTNQASVQKCMSLKSLKLAKIALGFAILGLIVVFLMNFYTGLMIFNHYSECDPLTVGRITARDQLLPYYIMNTYEHIPTFAGIFVAGIFAASLGTVASALNSLSAVTCEDLLINGMNIKITPEKGAYYAKWMSLGYGILSFGLVFIVERLGGVLQATLTLNGLIGGITLGLFVLGITFKSANTKGAFYGGLASLAIVIFIGIGAQIFGKEAAILPFSVDQCDCSFNTTAVMATMANALVSDDSSGFGSWSIFKISYLWYSALGCLLTVALGQIISMIINAIQKRNVLKINSAKATNNITLTTEAKWKPDIATSTMPVTIISANEKNGHDNPVIRLDDE